MKRKIGLVLGVAGVFTPLMAFAQVTDADTLISKITNIINLVIPLLIAIAVVWFIYNVVKYVLAADNEEKRTAAKDGIVHGLIGLFVIVAFWGIINIVINTLDLNNTTPTVDTGNLIPN